MEVILVKDVKRVGDAGETVDVADGYARNYLIPRGLAVPATKAARKQAAEQAAARERQEAEERAAAKAYAEALQNIELVFTARSGDSERLYGSITSSDIAERLSEQIDDQVDKRKVMLDDPIRELGTFEVPVKLHNDVQITVKVIVESET